MIVLGIDPGYAIVGCGVVEYQNNRFRMITYGAITTEAHTPFNERIEKIYDGAAELMKAQILAAAQEGDSVGGILETMVLGMPGGVGEPWFDTVEGMIAHSIFSVPAVKGVEFGAGFDITRMRGSEANDCLRTDGQRIYTKTNNSGGINGGITSGMPIVFRTAIKPTASIFKEQETVDIIKGENAVLSLKGRHDPAIVHRAAVVVSAVTAITLSDLLAEKYGADWLRTGENR